MIDDIKSKLSEDEIKELKKRVYLFSLDVFYSAFSLGRDKQHLSIEDEEKAKNEIKKALDEFCLNKNAENEINKKDDRSNND